MLASVEEATSKAPQVEFIGQNMLHMTSPRIGDNFGVHTPSFRNIEGTNYSSTLEIERENGNQSVTNNLRDRNSLLSQSVNSAVPNQTLEEQTYRQVEEVVSILGSRENQTSTNSSSSEILHSSNQPPSSTSLNTSLLQRIWNTVCNFWNWIIKGETDIEESSLTESLPQSLLNNAPDNNNFHVDTPLSNSSNDCGPGNPPKKGYGRVMVGIAAAGVAIVLFVLIIRKNPQRFKMTVDESKEFARLLVMSAIPKLLEADKYIVV